MARVHYRKARKDYPEAGISKGDMYYTTRIKTGPYSSRTIRQKDPIKRSQMTTSEFLGSLYALQEEFDPGCADDVREAATNLREIGETEQEKFDNMPDSLQYGDTGQMIEARANSCEEVADILDSLADELEDLPEDGNAFDPSDWAEETSAMDGEDAAEFLAEKEREFDDREQQRSDKLQEAVGELDGVETA